MDAEDISFEILLEITDGFSEERKLGQGAFGVVYKGVTRNGDEVAVKKLVNPGLNFKQLKNEFYNLTKLNHQNILQVLGYCFETEQEPFILPDGSKVFVEETHVALCLEYMHNGSLQRHLSDEFSGLEWHTRFKIIKGTCEGLKYIHEELEEPIYHLDLKPDNILLDKDMVPKIADFGLSRIIREEPTRITQNPYGTQGYQPPEYIDRGQISGKFDIFSLGVVMIRIVSGPKGYPKCLDMSSDQFINRVQKNWRNKLQETYSSGSLVEKYCHQVKTCIQIALLCVDEDNQKRPSIGEITEKLNEIETGTSKLPKKGCLKKVSGMEMHNNKNIDMRKESQDIKGQHQNINLLTGPSCSELEFVDAREASSHVVEEFIVGRTEEKGKIIASLFNGMSKRIILPIYGVGGIGKTTFARLIYNDPEFKCYSQVWVDVSRTFDLNNIRESIISQLSGKESQAIERQHIIHSCLGKLLSSKKILVVLDDLWEVDQFYLDELMDMLYHADSNIIILVTTCSQRVAQRICDNLQPYKILPLTNDMCWDIIKQRSAFEARDDKKQLADIGRKIAQKCGGVALAAQSLVFTLCYMNSQQWMNVKDSDIWNEPVSNNASLPNRVLESLKLSYSQMDLSLKKCFTYCAIFPKGHKIVKDDVIYQWISLNFIKPTKIFSNLQLCEKYIAQLLGLSFLQHSASPKEDVTEFTMHDLVHDLARSIMLYEILDTSKQCNTGGSRFGFALLNDCSKSLKSLTQYPTAIRALRFRGPDQNVLHGASFSSAKYLCVLDLSQCSIRKLPYSIGNLKHLRYLNAPRVKHRAIPNCITRLKKLIYLSLRGSSDILALPEAIGEMESLMYLDLSGCSGIQRLPESLGELERLVHLDLANCSSVKEVSESLRKLTALVHLNLSNCFSVKDVSESLMNLRALQYLNLSHCTGLSEHEMLRLIDCICTMYKLEHLDLSDNGSLTTLPISIANLRKMHTLKLKFMVKARDGLSSNLVLLLDANNTDVLNISGLENVKSTEEALKIKLMGKKRIAELVFDWTRDAKRFVMDRKVLEYLVPPKTLNKFKLGGYSSEIFPYWLMGIAYYLPNLTAINMEDLANCDSLPPLGQLRNLVELVICGMDSITDIDESFYGGPRAFYRLKKFDLRRMGGLKLWKTMYSFEDGLEELMSPNLEHLTINDCPMLRLIPCPPSAVNWKIEKSDNVLSSWGEAAQICTSSTTVLNLSVKSCEVPFQQWRLLHHIPALTSLNMERCSDLRSMSQDIIKSLSSLQSLSLQDYDQTEIPEWLGELTSLRDLLICGHPEMKAPLEIMKKLTFLKSLRLCGCERIATLPQWFVELTSLQVLEISDCPNLDKLHDSMQHLTSLQTLALRNCGSISVLPKWLGDLVTLKELVIQNCVRIKSLPASIERFTKLEELKIIDCPELTQWCQLDEIKTKLINHIETKKQKDHCISRNHTTDSKIQNTTWEDIDQMTYTQLDEITNGFSEERKIGQGAYGKVYWGFGKNGEKIAVKLLLVNMQELDDQQFRNELINLKMLEHPNIVQLVGYCYETQQKCIQWNGIDIFPETRYRALCLEYLHNGSLRNHLCEEFGEPDWHTRYKIIKGTCEGLNYLHNGSSKPIYHLDLKPDNILLDKNMVPKLADFGLSKILHGDGHTWTTQNFAGTLGYLPPEYINGQIVSDKLDIYSLGVVMIEIIAGPKGRTKSSEMPPTKFIDQVCGNWRKRLQVISDGSLLEAYCEQVKRCTQLSLKCVENDRHERPGIVDITDELNEVERLTKHVKG